MRALVTGGAGFIGSHLVRALLAKGLQVRVLDNFSTGRRENLHGLAVEVIEADLRQAEAVRRAVQNVDWVFHLAAFISVPQSLEDPETCFAVNVGGTAILLEACRRAGVGRVIFASSTAVYGEPSLFPTPEEALLAPLSPYALSKQIGEQYMRFYWRVFGLPTVSLRYYNVYGPRQRPDSPYAAAIPLFARRLLHSEPLTVYGDGKQSRDFVFVEDVVNANLLAAASSVSGEELNVCTGVETSVLDLIQALATCAARPPKVHFAPPRTGDIYRSLGDPRKAERLIGFRAQVSLEQGLRQTLDWMKISDS